VIANRSRRTLRMGTASDQEHCSRARRAPTGPWQRASRRAALVCAVVAMVAISACSSGHPRSGSTPSTSAAGNSNQPAVKTLGPGVSDASIKVGIALVDFSSIEQYTDLIRTNAEQKQIYQMYIDNINAHGGINGRKIVPYYQYYSPLGTAGIGSVCTSLTQDDNVFAVIGTFVDFSGAAQTCVANQERRVLMTYNLTQAIIDKSPGGLVTTAGDIPERSASILIQLLQKKGTLKGRTVAVLGDTTESTVVNDTIVPALKKSGVRRGDTAVLAIQTTGDTAAALDQLTSFMEKWKTEHVDTVFLSGDLASSKQIVLPLKKELPNVLLVADTTDTLVSAQQVQQAGIKPNPYEGLLTAGGLSPKEYDDSANWKYCADIYQAATGKPAPDSEHTIKLPNGKINDINGVISNACQSLTMFHDIGERVGQYLNAPNWIDTVNNFGPIENRGSGPYSSLHAGKYAADDNWRLQEYDSSLGNTGLWKAVTPLQDITGN
jgi:ABC-type branched-subunit amino acid transport system substrate-binding protein